MFRVVIRLQIIVINLIMRNTIFKIVLILSFLIIIIPSKKVYLPIFLIEIANLSDLFSYCEDLFSLDTIKPFLVVIGILLFLLKNIKYNFLGHLLFLIWLIIFSKLSFFVDYYYLSTLFLHLIISFFFYKKYYK